MSKINPCVSLPFDPEMIWDLFPNCEVITDDQGQIIIHTRMYDGQDEENAAQREVPIQRWPDSRITAFNADL